MIGHHRATAISFGQTITISTVLNQVPSQIPNLHPDSVLKAGAAGLSQLVSSPTESDSLSRIWNTAISRAMILSVAFLASSVPFTLGMEWLNVKDVTKERKASRVGLQRQQEEPKEGGVISDAGVERNE